MPDPIYLLQSSEIAVTVIPSQGGRIASLISRRSGLEFLTQSPHSSHPFSPQALFQEGYCAGIEECLPTVGISGPQTEGGAAPDHGDFWRLPWSVDEEQTPHRLKISANGYSRPFRFSKEISVEGNLLRIQYTVQNIGQNSESFLYACHPLFAVDPGDRVELPEEVHSLKLNYSLRDRLGKVGNELSWPQPADSRDIDLSVAGGPTDETADMLYTRRLVKGMAGIHRLRTNQRLQLTFDTKTLPYLGIWLCYGGWPEPGHENLQYAVALEPATAPEGTLHAAQQAGYAITLAPNQQSTWHIDFRIITEGV